MPEARAIPSVDNLFVVGDGEHVAELVTCERLP
jgi:hypothetical protein